MPDIRDFCDRLWNGEIDTIREAHPIAGMWNDRQPDEIADNLLYFKSVASANTIDTGDGLVMLDTGTQRDAEPIYQGVRQWRSDPSAHRLAAAVFSHHHVDHIFGVEPFDQEASEHGVAAPTVYGQANIPLHFDRYQRTVGYNTAINSRQFFRPGMDAGFRIPWPDQFRYPDVTFDSRIQFRQGDCEFHVTHTRGETEDAAWTWVPQHQLLCPGDLFIWAVPNAGNPQKVQRWAGEWAAGLRQMAALGAETMLPGHGFPIFGADRISQALNDTADLLDAIESRTLALMNTGATLDRVLHEIELPADLLDKPYLRSAYDHPEFIVRNVWRFYGGWYQGQPDHLLPAPRAEEAAEYVRLAGGLDAFLERAQELLDAGNTQMACHIIETAAAAAGDGATEVHALRERIYEARAAEQDSSMARGIFSFAAASSRAGCRDAFNP